MADKLNNMWLLKDSGLIFNVDRFIYLSSVKMVLITLKDNFSPWANVLYIYVSIYFIKFPFS